MTFLVTLKDIFYHSLGVILGLVVGIGIYWIPLKQFKNEWKALWNLISRRYHHGESIGIKSGTDLKRVGMVTYPNLLTQEKTMSIWHDEGVSWFHATNGWTRVRVLQVYEPNSAENIPPIFRICHLDIV